MAAAKVTTTTIVSNPHLTIFSYLDNRSYVTDPRNKNSTENLRQFVYDTDPLSKGINFSFFPYIYIEFPTLVYSNTSSCGKQKDITWKQIITVRSVKDGSANTRSDIGRQDMLDILDDINALFNSEARKIELRTYGLYDIKLSHVSVDSTLIDQQEVYETVLEIEYSTRMIVSS